MADNGLIFRGSLFSLDFLKDAITRLPEWKAVSDADIAQLASDLRAIADRFPTKQTPNESQTEDDLIWPILNRLGWTASLRQQNLAAKGRDDVPDGLLFQNDAKKAEANAHPESWKRYGYGLALVESKRWGRPLDRRSNATGEELAPSTQMLRYLRRADDLTEGKLRWGILTNGAQWRLYYQGARSVSEEFFEINLGAILGIAGHDDDLFALTEDERLQWLRVFLLIFRRDAFISEGVDTRTFHQRALAEGRFYEERVAENLSSLVFEDIFPTLVKAIATAAPEADLQDVREAALILLYRLLFLLFAEDRDLLPVNDARYDDYGLRDKVRKDIGDRKDRNDTFSSTAARYWSVAQDLSRAIDKGDASIGLPPYNGGLFNETSTPLLSEIRLPDNIMADVIDRLSFERSGDTRKYINYRDMSVQQLGSIYERLLEHEIRIEDGELVVRPNIFARKGSGSYYTPDDLVRLILRETLETPVMERMEAFRTRAEELNKDKRPIDYRLGALKPHDPAERLLELRICDPAMGSGHFLVSLVDYLTDNVIAAMAEAAAIVEWADYVSPLVERIERIRGTILHNAEVNGWTVDEAQLDDRHIIRRMVLKRCVYGVDKNQMAVELAKVSLWLHTFTVGAPLSFLDHHLRCGDSLFGSWVRPAMDKLEAWGSGLLLFDTLRAAKSSATHMQSLESLTDADIAEVHQSAEKFDGIVVMTDPLNTLLSMVHAIHWLDLKDKADIAAVQEWLKEGFGDVIKVAQGKRQFKIPAPPPPLSDIEQKKQARSKKKTYSPHEMATRFKAILDAARELIDEEKFLNWQVAFPGVWTDWESGERKGGFDAVIGNPPWDRMKLQQVEWFAARRPAIALTTRAADRKRMIEALEREKDPLATDFEKANTRAEASVRTAREIGDYPLLSNGDINLYSLFVERAMNLVKPQGVVGLLTPSGIASDKTAAPFFKGVATTGRLKALYDFENRRTRYNADPFFPDVDSRFKFCAMISSPKRTFEKAMCAFFLQDVSELNDPDRCFPLSAEDFARVNPNTGTAPIFRTRRDAALTTEIYGRLPVLVDRSDGGEAKAWPVKYATMFHMTSDSGLFRTREELEEKEKAYPTGGNTWHNVEGDWLPLYVGRMIHQFDHRAASVSVNAENLHNAAFSEAVTSTQKADRDFIPTPQYWINAENVDFPKGLDWIISFRDIARATDVRTIISTISPKAGYGNKLPLLIPTDIEAYRKSASLLAGNLNAFVFDFVARSKIHSTSVNWYLFEQLPVVPAATYATVKFGKKTAGELIRAIVLELTYTAHDMAPFAKDMGYVDKAGQVLPPFIWDDERRLELRAKLDAVYFHLYGVTKRDDIRYIYSTFPIVEAAEKERYGGVYRSLELCLAWVNALSAGAPDAKISL